MSSWPRTLLTPKELMSSAPARAIDAIPTAPPTTTYTMMKGTVMSWENAITGLRPTRSASGPPIKRTDRAGPEKERQHPGGLSRSRALSHLPEGNEGKQPVVGDAAQTDDHEQEDERPRLVLADQLRQRAAPTGNEAPKIPPSPQ